ncbi:MAG: hypothetical protein WC291_04870 [Thermodesulfovibrionales bacterium]|jgi:hypothetical protein
MAMSSRNVAIGLVAAVVFVIIAFLVVSRTEIGGDKGAYKDFYKEIIGKMKVVDTSFKPFSDAMSSKQWVEAVKIAKNEQGNLSKDLAAVETLKVPDLKDDKVEKELQDAKQLLTDAYLNKISIMTNFLAFAKDPATAKETDEAIKKNIEGFSNDYRQGMEKLVTAGQKLGVNMDRLIKESK